MTFLCQTALQAAVGFAIGAGTNDLAIRWLFATVFTKKKKAIAESVQEVVSSELMSSDKIVAQLSRPEVRTAIEGELRAEIDAACRKAGALVGGLSGGLRPFLPGFVRDEADAVLRAGSAFTVEARAVVARLCAEHAVSYLTAHLPQLIDKTRVWNIIYDSIMALDEDEMELLTRQVANRELRGITIWGGVIGAAVGVAMSFLIRFAG